jgi:hypothetical protein
MVSSFEFLFCRVIGSGKVLDFVLKVIKHFAMTSLSTCGCALFSGIRRTSSWYPDTLVPTAQCYTFRTAILPVGARLWTAGLRCCPVLG